MKSRIDYLNKHFENKSKKRIKLIKQIKLKREMLNYLMV